MKLLSVPRGRQALRGQMILLVAVNVGKQDGPDLLFTQLSRDPRQGRTGEAALGSLRHAGGSGNVHVVFLIAQNK